MEGRWWAIGQVKLSWFSRGVNSKRLGNDLNPGLKWNFLGCKFQMGCFWMFACVWCAPFLQTPPQNQQQMLDLSCQADSCPGIWFPAIQMIGHWMMRDDVITKFLRYEKTWPIPQVQKPYLFKSKHGVGELPKKILPNLTLRYMLIFFLWGGTRFPQAMLKCSIGEIRWITFAVFFRIYGTQIPSWKAPDSWTTDPFFIKHIEAPLFQRSF